MSALEEQVINICNKVFDERKGELAPTSEINSPWMTEIQLAEYWQLRNKDGELSVHSIRKWTARPDDEHPGGRYLNGGSATLAMHVESLRQ